MVEVIAVATTVDAVGRVPGSTPNGSARSRRRGGWRTVVALPAVVGSTLLMLVLLGWAGRWEPLLMLAWLASGAAVFTGVGERAAVRADCGFRPLSARQQVVLGPPWLAVLDRCSVPADSVTLYVQRSREPNAYAVGGRSVAVTTGVAAGFLAKTLTEADLSALLAHELGHHAHGAIRFSLVTMWLAAPWRIASRLVLGLALRLSGREPGRLLAAVVAATVVVAVVQAVQRHQLLIAGVLAALALCGVVCRLADAALSRRDELAADRFAAQAGYGAALTGALHRLDVGQQHQGRPLLERALARHPPVETRLDALHDLPADEGTFAVTSEATAWPQPVRTTRHQSVSRR